MSSNWPPAGGAGSGTGGYGADDFGLDPDYPSDGSYGWQGGQSQPYSYADADHDSSGYGIAAYEADPRDQAAYRQDQDQNQNWYGRDSQAQGSYGQGSYGQGSYEQGSPAQGSYDQSQYDQTSYPQDPYGRTSGSYYQAPYDGTSYGDYALEGSGESALPQNGYDRSYRRDSYGADGYGTNGYDTNGDGANGYNTNGYAANGTSTGSYGTGDYGTGSLSANNYDTGSYGTSVGSQPANGRPGYSPPDYTEGDAGPDSYGRDLYSQGGYVPSRPGTGTYDEQDSVTFARPETGSFGRPDTGAYGRSSSDQGNSRASGYEPWHDAGDDGEGWEGDESDGDWHDEGDSGLLSRRFSEGDDDPPASSGRGSHSRNKKAKRPRRLRGRVAVLASILAAALVVGAISEYGYHKYEVWHTGRYGDYAGLGTGEVNFLVPQNAALSDLGPALVKAGVIMEVRPFESAAAAATGANNLQPGVYVLHHHMSAANAVKFLLSPAHRLNDAVTIIEGMRASKIAQILSAKTHIPLSQFTQLIDHPSQLGLPSWASGAKNAEGFLFPDTYDILPGESALKILRTMVAEFNQQMNSIDLAPAAKKVSTDAWHVLIVASMVQAEAGSPQDFGKIARVVWNRLAANMPLEFDSTVFYAMGIYGTAINSTQEKFNSPYNTYQHTGLPPGPIGNPGLAAIQATLHPPHGDWLYFITDTRHKPYQTHFTNSLTQLQTWQQEFGN
jgi:UPF0755 protein